MWEGPECEGAGGLWRFLAAVCFEVTASLVKTEVHKLKLRMFLERGFLSLHEASDQSQSFILQRALPQ